MRITIPLAVTSLALGAFSYRENIAKRDIDALLGVISEIDDAVSSLTKVINGFSDNGSDVETSSENVISVIKKGVETANSQEQLSPDETIQLSLPVRDLTDKTRKAVDAAIEKKGAFISAGLGGKIKAALQEQYDSSNSLANAISSKVPESLQEIAKNFSAGISKAIQEGVDEYADIPDSTTTGSSSGSVTKPTGSTSFGGSTSSKSTAESTAEPTNEPTHSHSGPGPGPSSPTPTPTPTSSGGTSSPTPSDGGSVSGTSEPFPGAATVYSYSGLSVIAAIAAAFAV